MSAVTNSGTANGGDDDVGLTALFFQRGRAGVANRDRGVAIALLHHQRGHRLADDVAASENDTLLARSLDIVTVQKGHDAQRSGRDEARQSDVHATDVDGVETVHVLAVVDSHDDLLLVDMLRQRQLNDEAIDILVFVEAVNTSQQLFLRHVILIADERRGKTALLAGDNLVFTYVSEPPSCPTRTAAR